MKVNTLKIAQLRSNELMIGEFTHEHHQSQRTKRTSRTEHAQHTQQDSETAQWMFTMCCYYLVFTID